MSTAKREVHCASAIRVSKAKTVFRSSTGMEEAPKYGERQRNKRVHEARRSADVPRQYRGHREQAYAGFEDSYCPVTRLSNR